MSGKTVITDDGPLPIDVPRDRDGTFEPRLIAKHERRFTSAEAAGTALDAFERGPWGQKFPTVVASWRRAWTT